MPSTKVQFTNAEGLTLTGRLEQPAHGRPAAYALFAHCFTCTKNLKAATNITRAINDSEIAVLRFDFTGLGESEGDFEDTNFSSNVTDLIAAAKFLEAEYEAPQILIGHSLGGTAVLQAAPSIASSRAVATIGAPATAAHVGHLLGEAREDIERRGEAEVLLAGRTFRVKKQFIEDIERQDIATSIHKLRRALLVMHSPVDEIVEIDNASAIFTNALHPKSFVSLDDADHLLSREADSVYTGAVLAAWASRYLDRAEAGEETTAFVEPLKPGAVAVRTGATGFHTQVNAAGHHLMADEPVAYGGTDLGPTPYDLLSAALGTCTSMTLRMYADRKQWPVQSITVDVEHGKIHVKDCADCETESGKIDSFNRMIRLEGLLDNAQKERLLEIADKCPVHRTLRSEVKVRTALAE